MAKLSFGGYVSPEFVARSLVEMAQKGRLLKFLIVRAPFHGIYFKLPHPFNVGILINAELDIGPWKDRSISTS